MYPAPGQFGCTIWLFREILIEAGAVEQLFEQFDAMLAERNWSDLPRAKRSKRKIAEAEARLPLHPRHAAQPPSGPPVEVFEFAPLAEAEVTCPTSQQRIETGDRPLQRDAAMASRQVAHPVLESGNGLGGNDARKSVRFLQREAGKGPVPRPVRSSPR